MNPDPLCPATEHHHDVRGCVCRRLKTARLQGPVRVTGHVDICWCPRCFVTDAEVPA